MKNQKAFLILLGLASVAAPLPAQQQTNDPQQRAVEMLRQIITERERRRGETLPAPAKVSPPPKAPVKTGPTFVEIEQQYLQGKITAKQFQQYLRDHNLTPPPKTTVPTDSDAAAREVLRQQSPGTSPEQAALTDVEKKMDELLRLKAAREQAALTNALAASATNSAAAAPKTKRQRLDELLKLYIENKIPEAEYNEKRSKIIAEPD